MSIQDGERGIIDELLAVCKDTRKLRQPSFQRAALTTFAVPFDSPQACKLRGASGGSSHLLTAQRQATSCELMAPPTAPRAEPRAAKENPRERRAARDGGRWREAPSNTDPTDGRSVWRKDGQLLRTQRAAEADRHIRFEVLCPPVSVPSFRCMGLLRFSRACRHYCRCRSFRPWGCAHFFVSRVHP